MTSLARLIVSVSELDTSLAFYAGVLGLTLTSRQGDFATLAIGQGMQLGLHERGAEPSDLAVAAGFTVVDLDQICTSCQHLGTLVEPPEERPWGERMAVVRDPDGHLICLTEQQHIDQPTPTLTVRDRRPE